MTVMAASIASSAEPFFESDSPSGGERVGNAALVRRDSVIGHGPGAAVDEKDGLAEAAGRGTHGI